MILHEMKRDVQTSTDLDRKKFKVNANAKMFQILSSGIYTHKVRAVIRELSCNALDAHTAAGQTKPFVVNLPTIFDGTFSVRDFGAGLSEDEIYEIFTTYFYSTKSESNDYVGALGLGSKSPFCLVDSFTVISYQNGTETSYLCSLDGDGEPTVCKLTENPTNEESGLCVSLSVEGKSYEFKREAVEVFQYFESVPDINIDSVKQEIEDARKDFADGIVGDGYAIANEYDHDGLKAVMGNVAYDIPSHDNYNVPRLRGYVKFQLGDLSFDPGRENLSLDEQTIECITNRLAQINEELRKGVEAQLAQYTTKFEKALFANKLMQGALHNIYHSLKVNVGLEPYHGTRVKLTYGGRHNEILTNIKANDKAHYFIEGDKAYKTRLQYFLKQNGGEAYILKDEHVKFWEIPASYLRNTDDLPAKPRQYNGGGGGYTRIAEYVNGGWTDTKVEVNSEERVYVMISKGIADYYTQRVLNSFVKETGITLYGAKPSFPDTKAFKNGNWIELRKYVEREYNKVQKIESSSSFIDGLFSILNSDEPFYSKINELNEEYKKQEIPAFLYDCGLVESIDLFTSIELSIKELFPMLQCLDGYDLKRNKEIVRKYMGLS